MLVLGEDSRSFLSTIRSFGRAGLSVDVGWARPGLPAMASRYIDRSVEIAPYRTGESRWRDDLNRLMAERDYDFVIGCHDAQVLPLQHHRAGLDAVERYALMSPEAFAVAFSKAATHALAESLGVPVPPQRVFRRRDELDATIAAAIADGNDLYLKPMQSTRIDEVGRQYLVHRVGPRRPAPVIDDSQLEHGVLVQTTVPGRGVGVELLARDGRILTAFQHERVHEPPAGGGSSYRRSAALDPGMLDASRRLVEATSMSGVAMFEFKRDPATRRWWLMEINGRLWGSLPLTIAAGIDIPLFWYQMQRQGRIDFPQQYRIGLYARSWHLDRNWFKTNRLAHRQEPGLCTIPPLSVLGELRHVLGGNERSDTLVSDDPAPAGVELRQMLIEPAFARLRRLPPWRLLARRRAERAVRDAHSVLFVCFGNICRSPFAEHAARFGPRLRVVSAGTHPHAGRSSPDDAVAAARRIGVDLSAHRSQVVDAAMLEAADVVFVFDLRNERDLLARFPAVRRKLHQLSAVAPGPIEIPDPYGEGPAAFDACYARVMSLLRRVGALCAAGGSTETVAR